MKNTVSSLLVSGLLLGLPACVVVQNPHPHGPPPAATTAPAATPAATTPAATTPAATTPAAQPAYTDTPEPTTPLAEPVKSAVEGRPSEFHRGAPEAYWVWHDGGGWHLRTTTQSHLHRFSGRVWVPKGEVGEVRMVRSEHNDRFRKSGNSMTFDFQTLGDEDGFEFKIAEGNCAYFHLYIDGKPVPSRIFLGARNVSPAGAGFKACW
jgi:hypothetical protein